MLNLAPEKVLSHLKVVVASCFFLGWRLFLNKEKISTS